MAEGEADIVGFESCALASVHTVHTVSDHIPRFYNWIRDFENLILGSE